MEFNFNKAEFLIAKILKRVPLSNSLKVSFNTHRHKKINQKLLPYFLDAEKNYELNNSFNKSSDKIWIFWWQGKEKMPALVKNCYTSVVRNYDEGKVILITKNNFSEYTDISENILKLLKKGKITLTHFSDILRFNLLKNYGGLWLDATVFVSKEIDKNKFSEFYTCSGYDDEDYFFVTKGNWCGFLIGGSSSNSLFSFMDKFFEIYWTNTDELLDYFLIDYALNYAWEKNIGGFKSFTQKNIHKDNPNLFNLQNKLNERFNEKDWKILSNNTNMFKLSYKKKILNRNGTFYNVLLQGEK